MLWMGIVLRSRGVWIGRTISLWEDEAAWAMRLIDLPLKEHVLRSLGFMAVTKGLVTVFSASERVLRFLPWCAGVGAVLVAPLVAKRLFRSTAAQLLFVAILALHPSAIDLSKEFKPYSVALLMHLLLLLFVLRYAADGKERDLLAGIMVAFFGVLFSQDVVFAYPALFGLMALKAYQSKNRDHLVTLLVGAGFAIALLLALRNNMGPKLGDMDQGAQYWGNKYNVFYVNAEGQGSSRVGWIAARFDDLAAMLGNRREIWHWSSISPAALATLERLEASIWILLCVTGVAALAYQRRFLHLGLLTLPLLVAAVFNYFGFWPLGAFRTNLFAVAYLAGIAATAFDWRRGQTVAYWEALPAALLVVLPFLTVGRSNHSRKESFTAQAAFPQAAQELIALQGKGRHDSLELDARSCAPWRYYAHYHPGRHRTKLASRFNVHCGKTFQGMVKAARSALTTPESRVFMLAAGEEQMEGLQKRMPKDLRVVAQKLIGKQDALVLSVARAAK